MIVDELDIGKDTGWKIVIGKKRRKVCLHFVQHTLTEEQKAG